MQSEANHEREHKPTKLKFDSPGANENGKTIFTRLDPSRVHDFRKRYQARQSEKMFALWQAHPTR
jgi:hypothetical protein